MRTLCALLVFGVVLQQPAPSSQSCMAVMKKEARIVVPYGFTGEVCYETAGQSFVCESAKARAERLAIR